MNTIKNFYSLFGLLLSGIVSITSQLITSQLYQDLFTKNEYTSDLLPICENWRNVTVKMDIALRQIIDLDERAQIITTGVWVRMRWNDCRLTWNASQYNGTSSLNVPFGSLWIPDITLFDSAAEEVIMPGREEFRATISSDGSVAYNFPTVLKSICRIDVTYFPFDTQICPIQFGSWSHHGGELDLFTKGSKEKGDLNYFVEHDEWSLEGVPAKRNVVMYACCSEPFPDITYYLTLKRKPQFYILTTLFPCFLINLSAVFSFILPVESGEKVSLGVTVLLSLSVFLIMVDQQLPASKDTFPYISLYFAASMTLVTLSCVLTAIILNIHYRGVHGKRVPKWLRYIVIDKLGYLLNNKEKIFMCCWRKTKNLQRNNAYRSKQPYELEYLKKGNEMALPSKDPISIYLKDQSSFLKKLWENAEKDSKLEDISAEWQEVAFIMDRFLLFFFILATVLNYAIFIGVMANH